MSELEQSPDGLTDFVATSAVAKLKQTEKQNREQTYDSTVKSLKLCDEVTGDVIKRSDEQLSDRGAISPLGAARAACGVVARAHLQLSSWRASGGGGE